MATKICPFCGAVLNENVNFCSSCGNNVSFPPQMQQPAQGSNSTQSVIIVILIVILCAVLLFVGYLVFSHSSSAPQEQTGTIDEEVAVEVEPENPAQVVRLNPTGMSGDFKVSDGQAYVPSRLNDGNLSTCWALDMTKRASFADSYGYGPVRVSVKTGKLDKMVVCNGYQKSDYVYKINCRPKSIVVYNANDTSKPLISASLSDIKAPQTLRVTNDSANHDITDLLIYFPEYYPGSKYMDLCVSELEFYGAR